MVGGSHHALGAIGELVVRRLEGQEVMRRLSSMGASMGLVTSPTLVAHWLRRGSSYHLKVYDKATLVDPPMAEEVALLRVVELGPGITAPPALDTTGVVWSTGRTLMGVDYWVQRGKCEEQVEREARREAEEEAARLVELGKSTPSYFSEEVGGGGGGRRAGKRRGGGDGR